MAVAEYPKRAAPTPAEADVLPAPSSFRTLAPACTASFALHLALLLVLGSWWLEVVREEQAVYLATLAETERPPLEQTFQEFELTHEESVDTGSPSVVGAAVANSAAPIESTVIQLQNQTPHLAEMARIETPVLLDIASAAEVAPNLTVRGSADVGVTGTLGALDRITQEILLSLAQERTLVVWIFDQSGSMQPQRQTIRERFDRIYRELGLSEHLAEGRTRDQPLLSAVMAFGKEVTFRCDPTDDLDALRKAVDGIDNDPSGVERVLSAVGLAAKQYRSLRTGEQRRNVLIVVFTDEAGDDGDQLDATLGACVRSQMPVYVVGSPAPFGRREVEVAYVDPDPRYDQSVQMVPVHQGPESMAVETVSLGFAQFGGESDRRLRLDSGFGPFHLTRLCVESGGIYFAVHPNRARIGVHIPGGDTPLLSAQIHRFFDPDMMRRYAPDYVTQSDYERLISDNRARLALVEAAKVREIAPMDNPRLFFAAFDEAQFKQSLDQAQRASARLQPQLEGLYNILRQGIEDRARLHHARWEAGFDLAIGRVLAVKARTEGYNHMLAKAKNGMKFANDKNNAWRLEAADDLSINSALERMASDARMYLERVVRDHPDTPWAVLAELELAEPIGWLWAESYVSPPAPVRRQAGNNPPPRRRPPERPVQLQKPKPKREIML